MKSDSNALSDPDNGARVREKWLRFGLGVAVLQAAFARFVVVLLQIDLYLAAAAVVVLGTGGSLVLMWYVLYRY